MFKLSSMRCHFVALGSLAIRRLIWVKASSSVRVGPQEGSMTCPVTTSKLMNHDRMPCRMYSNSRRSTWPGSMGRSGCSRSKGLPKTKLSQYGKLCQEKKAWRDKSGTDRGSQSASVEHGQGTQGERTADVYGADGASARRRRPEASRTRTGLESCHYSQREA